MLNAKGEPYLLLKESSMSWSSEISHFIRKRLGTSSWLWPTLCQKKGCSLHVTPARGESGQPLTVKREIKQPMMMNAESLRT